MELAEKTGIYEDVIRQNYLSQPLKEKIDEIKKETIEISEGISELEGSDNYILLVDNIQTVIKIIDKLTNIKIPHKKYGNIPLEMAIGQTEIGDLKIELINRKNIIAFLKNDKVGSFRRMYKKEFGHGIRETFVVLTDDVVDDFKHFDKRICDTLYPYHETFFALDLDLLVHHGGIFTMKYQKQIFKKHSLRDRVYFDSLVISKKDFLQWAEFVEHIVIKIIHGSFQALTKFIDSNKLALLKEHKEALEYLRSYD